MTLKKKLQIEIELTSEASEADLSCHLNDICAEIANHADGIRFKSWHNEICIDYEKSLPVEIRICVCETLQ